MKTTKNVNLDYKALRENAGLTLEALARQINYSVAAVNGLENKDTGGKRLRQAVLEALTGSGGGRPAEEGGGGVGARDQEVARALERARVAEEKLDRMYEVIAELLKRRS